MPAISATSNSGSGFNKLSEDIARICRLTIDTGETRVIWVAKRRHWSLLRYGPSDPVFLQRDGDVRLRLLKTCVCNMILGRDFLGDIKYSRTLRTTNSKWGIESRTPPVIRSKGAFRGWDQSLFAAKKFRGNQRASHWRFYRYLFRPQHY